LNQLGDEIANEKIFERRGEKIVSKHGDSNAVAIGHHRWGEPHPTIAKLEDENGHPKVAGGLREMVRSDQQARALRGRELRLDPMGFITRLLSVEAPRVR
jgi:hypothetical protein